MNTPFPPARPGQRLSPNSALAAPVPVPAVAVRQHLRIRVNLDPPKADQLAPSDTVVGRPAPKLIEIKLGNTSMAFPYYDNRWTNKKTRRTYRSYILAWHDGLKRHREKRSTLKALRTRAGEIATSIVNGETTMLEFGQEQRASYKRSVELLRSVPGCQAKPLELAVSEYTQSVEILGDVPPVEAARYYVLQHPRGTVARTIPQIVVEFFARRTMGSKWRRVMKKMLDRFATHFTGSFQQITTRDLDDWLDTLKKRDGKTPIGNRSRRNYREVVAALIAFAKSRGYVSKDWDVMSDVSDPEPAPVEVNLYTPDELLQLLNKAETYEAGCKLVPFIAITAFAGVRHGEMSEEKVRLLDWSDIDFEAKGIYVAKGTAKTGKDRMVDMPDNLIAWLQPYARKSGRVCELKNTGSALCRLRTKAGIVGPKRNALRKSFISYKLALTRNIDGVADQAGNSSGIIRKTYKQSGTRMKALAERWFSLMPDRADILPLFAWSKRS